MKLASLPAFLLLAAPMFCQQLLPGMISGTVVDSSGAFVPHAMVKLSLEGRQPDLEVESADDGQFTFPNVTPGPYELSFSVTGFAARSIAGELHPGETLSVPETQLTLSTLISSVDVSQTQEEIAQDQIRLAEKQRLIGIFPNYYVNYIPDAVPLNPRQKFELAWKTALDPTSFLISGIVAGVQQSRNSYSGFGQGAQGYAKRYGASYGTFFTGTMLAGAVLPIVFKQDPRYFYKGTGTIRSRFFYAVSRGVICQGDNRKPQFCYSSILGDLASGAISNIYYPAKNRNGASLTFETGFISIGADALSNLFQEFVARKLTPKKP